MSSRIIVKCPVCGFTRSGNVTCDGARCDMDGCDGVLRKHEPPPPPDQRMASALERIATALEVLAWNELAGFQPSERADLAEEIAGKFREARNAE